MLNLQTRFNNFSEACGQEGITGAIYLNIYGFGASRCFVHGSQGHFCQPPVMLLPNSYLPHAVLCILIQIDLKPSVDGDGGYHGEDIRPNLWVS